MGFMNQLKKGLSTLSSIGNTMILGYPNWKVHASHRTRMRLETPGQHTHTDCSIKITSHSHWRETHIHSPQTVYRQNPSYLFYLCFFINPSSTKYCQALNSSWLRNFCPLHLLLHEEEIVPLAKLSLYRSRTIVAKSRRISLPNQFIFAVCLIEPLHTT